MPSNSRRHAAAWLSLVLASALIACEVPPTQETTTPPETQPKPSVTLKAISYDNFKSIGLTPQPLPVFALARTYLDINGERVLFTAEVKYTFSQTPQTATPGAFAFWRRQQDGTWLKDDALLPQGSDGCIHPRKAIVADFNGDAKQDVFVACHGWDQAPWPGERNNVVLSQADGTYLIKHPSSAVGFFHSAAATDFDGDGRPDVVVTDSAATESLRVFLNKGDGTFAADTAYRFPRAVGGRRSIFTVEVLDVNQDGHSDLFVAGHEWESGPPMVVINPGNGDLRTGPVFTLPEVPNDGVVLDVVATGSGAERALWLLRTSGGDGTFYESRVVQKVTWPKLASTVPESIRPKPWTPWIIPTVVNDTAVIGSDDASVDLALPY